MISLPIADGGVTDEEFFLQAGAILMVIAAIIVGILVGTVMRRRPGVAAAPKHIRADSPGEGVQGPSAETDSQPDASSGPAEPSDVAD